MYLHLGQSVVVPSDEVVGIFDLDITSQSKRTLSFLSGAEKAGRVISVSEELPKSFIVCKGKKDSFVYISQLLPSTLVKRAESGLTE